MNEHGRTAFKTVERAISMRTEIEPLLKKVLPDLDKDFMHRVIAFSLSGT
jgi:hypothetical protein